jgi:N-acetylmuramoyl-L-alanine amidase CwlD
MKAIIAAIFAALVAASAAAPLAGADAFIAAGYSIPSPAPFQILANKDEILAPAVPALRRLGAQVVTYDNKIELRGPNGSSVVAQLGSNRAKVGDIVRILPAAPSRRGEDLFLPVRAIAWYLGFAYRWDAKSRTIFLHPRIADITFSRLPDLVRVKITGSAPLSYSAGLLKNPSRVYVDIANADLFAAEQQIAVNEGDLVAVRASQHSLNPDLVRVVLDVKREDVEYSHRASDGDRSIVIDIPAAPLPAPKPGEAVTIRSIRLERRSDSMCSLIVEANGAPSASLSSQRDPPQAVIELSNVRLDAEQVEGSHPVVTSASAEQTGENGARIVLNFRSPQAVALARRPQGLCVLIGGVSLSDVTVVLDPGHGGRQPGAPGPSGLMEKEINLDIGHRADKLLRQEGARVIMTRSDDSSLIPVTSREDLRRELKMRADVANQNRADLFVAIHCNSSGSRQRRTGSETYYCTPRSLGLAKVMQQELVKELKLKDGGVHTCNFVVVSEAQMPAVLVEVAYINNAAEEALLGSPEFRERAAQAIVNGVRRYAEEGGLLEYYAEAESARAKRAWAAEGKPAEAPVGAEETKPGVGGEGSSKSSPSANE